MLLTPTVAIFLTTGSFQAQLDRPPPLTFDKHIDYIAWYNDFIRQGKKRNAYELYKGFCTDKNGQGGIPVMEGVVGEQYNQVKGRVWDTKDYPELAAYIGKCAPYFEILKKAVKRKDYWQPAPPDTKLLLSLMMPNLPSSRTAARALVVQAWMKQDDQPKALIDAYQTVLRNAHHIEQGNMLISLLVGTALRALVLEDARAALSEEILRDEDVSRTYKIIHRYPPDPRNRSRAYITEWTTALDTLQFLCADGKIDASRWKSIGFPLEGEHPLRGFDPSATVRSVDTRFGELTRIVAGPLTVETVRESERFETQHAPTVQRNPFLKVFTPGLTRSHQLLVRAEASRRGTLLTLALHAHHAKHGEWPESLDKIGKKLGLKGLEELRKDPFSDKDFTYKLMDGQPLLYSVACDGKDDGGRHDEKWGESEGGGDYVFWPYQRQ
ncbi:MAG: hypothetical protein JXQ75_12400 [Phycisphaerae bacterium]|nr:hypothetical protein [Phycisphaerae bacterium]